MQARSEPPTLAHQLESALNNSSSAALLDAPAMQLAAPEPAVPTLPAAVPILQLAVPEPVGRVS